MFAALRLCRWGELYAHPGWRSRPSVGL